MFARIGLGQKGGTANRSRLATAIGQNPGVQQPVVIRYLRPGVAQQRTSRPAANASSRSSGEYWLAPLPSLQLHGRVRFKCLQTKIRSDMSRVRSVMGLA